MFARIVEPRWCPLQFYLHTCYASAPIATGYIHTCCLSTIYIVDLHSLAELLWYPLLSYICTHCSSAINIVDLREYALQNLVATHGCPTSYMLHVSYLCHWQHPYVLLICWLHPYALLVCHLHFRPAFGRVVELRCYPLLSYIPTCCLYAINIADLHLCVAEPRWCWKYFSLLEARRWTESNKGIRNSSPPIRVKQLEYANKESI